MKEKFENLEMIFSQENEIGKISTLKITIDKDWNLSYQTGDEPWKFGNDNEIIGKIQKIKRIINPEIKTRSLGTVSDSVKS
jgi:hypothetical protein